MTSNARSNKIGHGAYQVITCLIEIEPSRDRGPLKAANRSVEDTVQFLQLNKQDIKKYKKGHELRKIILTKKYRILIS